MFLIYVNKIGKNWKGEFMYEFLFSDSIEDVDGEGWDNYPASGVPDPPDKKYIRNVGSLTSELKLNLVQESTEFSMYDAIDGIIALAWEDITEYTEYPERRIAFKFGEEKQSVMDKLYERDDVIAFEKSLKNEK